MTVRLFSVHEHLMTICRSPGTNGHHPVYAHIRGLSPVLATAELDQRVLREFGASLADLAVDFGRALLNLRGTQILSAAFQRVCIV